MTALASPVPFNVRRFVGITAKTLITLIAAFSTWFALMQLFGNDEGARRGSFIPVTLMTMSLALIATTSWIIPRLGGVLAIIGACVAGYLFRAGPWGLFGIAVPLAVLGTTIIVSSLRPRT